MKLYRLFDTVMRPLTVAANNSILTAVRNSFIITLPIVMAGSLAVLVNNLPIAPYQEAMLRFFGENWRDVGTFVTFGTFSVMSFILSITISYNMALRHNLLHPFNRVNPLISSIVGFACLLAVMYPEDGQHTIFQWSGVSGLFVSVVVSVVSSLIFTNLSKLKMFSARFYSEEADISTPNALSALFPAIIAILTIATFRGVLTLFDIHDVFQFTYNVMQTPFRGAQDSLGTAFLYVFILHILWFFGIHGANVIDPVTNDIYKSAIANNIEAVAAGGVPEHLFTKPFFDVFVFPGGAGATICLLTVLLIFAKRSSTRRVGQFSLLPALFNINEILTFGLPIVLNPFFLIPFILCPIAMGFSSYIFTVSGFLPYTIVDVDWTTPPLINAFVATNSMKGVIVQVLNIGLGVLIYMPFVMAYERMKEKDFKTTYNDLVRISIHGENDMNQNVLLSREDKVGAASRMMANELKLALENKELYLEYQPKVDILTQRVYSVEALIRWKHKRYGMIPPPLIITVAEDSDMINDLGMFVLEEATSKLAAWKKSGIKELGLSLNVSVKQLIDSELPDKISSVLSKKNLSPNDLEIEVTESIALNANAMLNITLQEIHKLGVKIAVDDFGMGHSSLVYLRQFPVDVLKIDASLSKDVLIDPNICAIIQTINKLCETLNVEMVVEHVETAPQLEALVNLGAVNIQGYFFSKPLGDDKLMEYLHKVDTEGLMPEYLSELTEIYNQREVMCRLPRSEA